MALAATNAPRRLLSVWLRVSMASALPTTMPSMLVIALLVSEVSFAASIRPLVLLAPLVLAVSLPATAPRVPLVLSRLAAVKSRSLPAAMIPATLLMLLTALTCRSLPVLSLPPSLFSVPVESASLPLLRIFPVARLSRSLAPIVARPLLVSVPARLSKRLLTVTRLRRCRSGAISRLDWKAPWR